MEIVNYRGIWIDPRQIAGLRYFPLDSNSADVHIHMKGAPPMFLPIREPDAETVAVKAMIELADMANEAQR